MKQIIIGVFLLSIIFCTAALTPPVRFSYSAQDEWPGVCVEGNQGYQSPINIDATKVKLLGVSRDERIRLHFHNEGPINGVLQNTGHSIKFVPDHNVQILVGPLGASHYNLGYITFHWGRHEGEGSEHLFDGKAEEFEAQFVYRKLLPGNFKTSTKLEHTLIVAVRGDETRQQVRNDIIFNKLDVSQVTSYGSSIRVNGVSVTDLLPQNRDYYFYYGSYTIPNCDEKVKWVVLKNSIQVPSSYLEQLRQVKDEEGNRIAFNFRDTQDTWSKSRHVWQYQSAG